MVQSVKEAISRIEAITELTGKVAYDHFTTAKQLPFAVYNYDFSTGGADDYNSVQYIDFTIELYSETRNFALEEKIIKTFIDVEIQLDSDYINEERMYQTTFNFTFPQKIS